MFETLLKPSTNHPNQHHIKKRHWCLGTAVILIGSWITHSTTATISDGASSAESMAFAETLSQTEPYGLVEMESVVLASEPAAEPEPVYSIATHKVKKGETLGSIFKKRQLDLAIPHAVGQHDIAKQLVSLSIGRDLLFKSDEQEQLRELHYPINSLQKLVVAFDGTNVEDANVIDLAYQTQQHTVSGEINSSLYDAALEAGLSINLVMEMVRIFGWDIDFVLDIRAGDTFHVIYEDYRMNQEKLADGDILAAEFTTQNRTYRAIRFADDNGNVSYYTPEGESMLGTFLRSPVEFSRISSRFGKRKHPILKKWRAHKGVDYAASRGTPIRATADGKVTLAGRKGGYGRTVVLRHAGRFSTLYAHMKGFAKGIRSGKRVRQGDVIGYIGSTGLATGPHLHYEFRVDGVHRNPLTYKTPKASSIQAELKPEFDKVANSWVAKLQGIAQSYQVAKADSSDAVTSQL